VRTPFRLTYADILARPVVETVQTLDCITGWYSTQKWSGAALWSLLEVAVMPDTGAALVRLRGASGYFGDFTLAEAKELVLATHVGGEVINHLHGFPVRVVAPTRRGWFWVKWVTEVEVISAAPG
jgi:DMSO/TMAO reductase YedYZ molybdopterin-dependent catalytic subunit